MFKNRAIQMKLVKTDDAITEMPELPKIEMPSKEDVIDVANEITKTSALAIISVIAAATIAKTISEIVIHHATK